MATSARAATGGSRGCSTALPIPERCSAACTGRRCSRGCSTRLPANQYGQATLLRGGGKTGQNAQPRELLLLLSPAERHRHVLVKQQPVFAALFQHRRVAPRHLLGAPSFRGQLATPSSRCPSLVAVPLHAKVVVYRNLARRVVPEGLG